MPRYIHLSLSLSRNKASKHPTREGGRIRFPDLDLVLSHIPLLFTHCRSSWTSKFSSIERDHPAPSPLSPYSGDLSSYKDVYRREAIGFSQPPSSTRPEGRKKKPLGNGIGCFIYTRMHRYRAFHFHSKMNAYVEGDVDGGWTHDIQGTKVFCIGILIDRREGRRINYGRLVYRCTRMSLFICYNVSF